jgi:hypothetical protein
MESNPVSVIESETESNPTGVFEKNKGTGAGGANTNKNGLPYENITDLCTLYEEIGAPIDKKYKSVKFVQHSEKIFINVNKSKLHSYMLYIQERNETIIPASGCKSPDEAYVDNETKNVFIIEKKYQRGTGSVDEKIQTGPFKKEHYSELFPNYKIHYIYCLCNWFKRDEYVSILNYLTKNNIPVFWGEDPNYKDDIVSYIVSNSL